MQNNETTPQVNAITPNELEDDEIDFEARGNPAAEKPYCWQSKAALRAIRASYGDDTRLLPYLMSTYLALCEIASDEGRPVFTKSIFDILVKAGGSYRKLVDVLGFLAGLGILHIQHNFVKRGKAPNTYSLLSVPRSHGAHHAQGSCTDESASHAHLNKERLRKEPKEQDTSFRDNEHAWRRYYTADELVVIDQYNTFCVPRGWWPVNADSEELHNALNGFQDHDSDWLNAMFQEAIEDRDAGDNEYNKPRGNKLIRILWANY